MRSIHAFTLLFLCLLTTAAMGQPVTTAFTYQGRLDAANAPANGLYDFRFRLMPAQNGNDPASITLCVDNLQVDDGLFQVRLDFGQAYESGPRFLEILVRPGAAGDCSSPIGFTALAPRQELTSSPLAAHARTAMFAYDANAVGGLSADAIPTMPGVNIFTNLNVFNGPFTGVGCSASLTGAEVFGIQKNESPGSFVGMYVRTTHQSSQPFYGYDAGQSRRWWTYLNGGDNSWRIANNGSDLMTIAGLGNVGFGTSSPTERLDVRGNIRFGSSGDQYAVGAPANQRIIAGRILQGGGIGGGVGFTVVRIQTGYYRVTFTTPFAQTPFVTANAVGAPRFVYILGVTTGVCDIIANNTAGSPQDIDLCFTAVGFR